MAKSAGCLCIAYDLAMASSLVLLVETILGARRVRRQAFAARQRRREAAERLRTLARNRDHARSFLEIVHAQRRRKACATRGRQYMVRSRAVVAYRLGAEMADEDCARIMYLCDQILRLGDRELEMLRGKLVGDGAGFGKIAHSHQGTAAGERCSNDPLA